MFLALSLALALGGSGAGCSKAAKDRRDIRAMFERATEAVKTRNGQAAVAMLSKGTVDYYTATLKLAVSADYKKCASLPPTQQQEILKLRLTKKKSELKGMDGKAFCVKTITDGEWGWGGLMAAEDAGIKDVKVQGDGATATLYDPEAEKAYQRDRTLGSMGGRWGRAGRALGTYGRLHAPPSYPIRFVREEGEWKIDETSLLPLADKELTDAAKDARLSMRDFLMAMMAGDWDGPGEMPTSIWDPMKDDKPVKKK